MSSEKTTSQKNKSKNSKKKQKNVRSTKKYPSLKPHLNLKTRFEEIDYDYLDKLTPEELEWLEAFTAGYTNADFRNPETQKLFPTVEDKRERYNRNNERNRCILTRAKANGNLVSMDEIPNIEYQMQTEDDYSESTDEGSEE